tara:strand:- start:270 stop:440 length:171 start_codon:yes stop_codon:yes gene_type:complete
VIEEIYYVIRKIVFTNLIKCPNIPTKPEKVNVESLLFPIKLRFKLCGTNPKLEKKG